MKYKCLMMDHDDTVVDSTASIHYPCFIEYLKINKPEIVNKYSLKSYFEKNYDPGVIGFFLDDVGLSREEFAEEQLFWERYVKNHIPRAYQGIDRLLSDFKREGGIIAVASHSIGEYIERDYRENGLTPPDRIYSWTLPEEKRKPSPFAIEEVCSLWGILPSEILVVDDSRAGLEMARAGGACFAAALWAHGIESINAPLAGASDFAFKSVDELYLHIFGNGRKT